MTSKPVAAILIFLIIGFPLLGICIALGAKAFEVIVGFLGML